MRRFFLKRFQSISFSFLKFYFETASFYLHNQKDSPIPILGHHLHMPSYFFKTFIEYPYIDIIINNL